MDHLEITLSELKALEEVWTCEAEAWKYTEMIALRDKLQAYIKKLEAKFYTDESILILQPNEQEEG